MLGRSLLVTSLFYLLSSSPTLAKTNDNSLQGICLKAIEHLTPFQKGERRNIFPGLYDYCLQMSKESRAKIPFMDDKERQEILARVFAGLRINQTNSNSNLSFQETGRKNECFIWGNYNMGEIVGIVSSSKSNGEINFYGPNTYAQAYLIQTNLEEYVNRISWDSISIEIKCGKLEFKD